MCSSDLEMSEGSQSSGQMIIEQERLSITPLATRFASLDIDIPLDGMEYVFTSPRGEVELRARCYAERDMTRFWYLFWSVVIIGIVVGIERFIRQRAQSPMPDTV